MKYGRTEYRLEEKERNELKQGQRRSYGRKEGGREKEGRKGEQNEGRKVTGESKMRGRYERVRKAGEKKGEEETVTMRNDREDGERERKEKRKGSIGVMEEEKGGGNKEASKDRCEE